MQTILRVFGTRAFLLAAACGLLSITAVEANAYPMPHPALCLKPCCAPTKTLVLNVQNPACCHDCACVKVCVPACCDGPPQVCARCGVLGRGIVTYTWCCGHRVTVVFTATGAVRVR